MDLMGNDRQPDQPPQKTRRIIASRREEEPLFKEIEEKDNGEEETDDDAASQLSEPFAKMDTEDQEDSNSSSVTYSDLTIHRPENSEIAKTI